MVDQLQPDWIEFLKLLRSHRVKYLLVGGHAVAVHGVARMTNDLDIFVEASELNARRLASVLRDFGFGTVSPSLAELAAPDRVFMLGRAPFRIDLLTRISGVQFGAAYERRARIATAAGTLNVISRADLIRNKRASGRTKDLLDLELLRRRRTR